MENKKKVIIISPSLNPEENVSGVSEIVRFIIVNNRQQQYLHFTIGKKDTESGGLLKRVKRTLRSYHDWKLLLKSEPEAVVHYSFPIDAKSVLRDYFFIHHAVKQRRRMVVHIHGGLYLTKKNRPWLINRMLRGVFRSDVPFVVLSEKEREIVMGEFGAKDVKVLPNCVDLTDAEAFSRKHKEEGQPLTLGYLGRIVETKGMDWLLLACKRLLHDGVDFRLKLAGAEAGGTDYLRQFSELLGERFSYAGLVSGAAKTEFLRSLDVFVLPTYFEGLPISLLETMSYGCVPVTTPVGSIPEVLSDGENGLFVKLKDDVSLAEAIRRLDSDRTLLQRLAQQARATIFTRFSPKTYIDRLNAIYRS